MSGLLSDKRRSPGSSGSAPDASGVDTSVSVYESFEEGDLSKYSGDTDKVTVQGSEVTDGSWALEDTMTNNPDNVQCELISTKTGPAQGETFRWDYYIGDKSNRAVALFAVQDADNYYGNRINNLGKRIEFTKVVNGKFSVIEYQTFDPSLYSDETWTWAEVSWGDDSKGLASNEATCAWYNHNDTKIADLTTTLNEPWTSGNLGWFINKHHSDPLRIDYMRTPPQ